MVQFYSISLGQQPPPPLLLLSPPTFSAWFSQIAFWTALLLSAIDLWKASLAWTNKVKEEKEEEEAMALCRFPFFFLYPLY